MLRGERLGSRVGVVMEKLVRDLVCLFRGEKRVVCIRVVLVEKM